MNQKEAPQAPLSVVETDEPSSTFEAIAKLAHAVYAYQVRLRAQTERALFPDSFNEDV